ncbi:hypothetical protein AB4Z09_26330 [Rhodococcus sp. TAF43]|uniref:hypothetical protein n=1 Tax=unclassified Rhodococcus (in: high G+C Gram-positive bacteria) TaxID=192944 RepID=UPI001581EF4D|nr:hypothetical protein [Rhodococcus sp. W8901]QKT10421.1 hypothetical protein HUN07_06550 [Rhodococcus sp. W8901]
MSEQNTEVEQVDTGQPNEQIVEDGTEPDLAALEHQRQIADLTEQLEAANQALARRDEQIEKHRVAELKKQIGTTHEVDPTLLHGSTVEELEAHAIQLTAWRKTVEAKVVPQRRVPLRSGYVRESNYMNARQRAVHGARNSF